MVNEVHEHMVVGATVKKILNEFRFYKENHWLLAQLLSKRYVYKKAFQLNANCPLADSLSFLANKFEHVGGGGRAVW